MATTKKPAAAKTKTPRKSGAFADLSRSSRASRVKIETVNLERAMKAYLRPLSREEKEKIRGKFVSSLKRLITRIEEA